MKEGDTVERRLREEMVKDFVDGSIDKALRKIRKKEIRDQIGYSVRLHLGNLIGENEEIATQLEKGEYKRHIREVEDFLGTRSKFTTCSHHIVPSILLGQPRVTTLLRSPGGELDIARPLFGTVNLGEQRPILRRADRQVVEFTGTHIRLEDPSKGCSETVRRARAQGATDEDIQRDGGLSVYLEGLRTGFGVFKAAMEKAGGEKVETYSTIFIEDTGGFILGAKSAYEDAKKKGEQMFRGKTLKDSLNILHDEGKILMTDRLLEGEQGKRFKQDIYAALGLWTKPMEMLDPKALATNLITIGRVAMAVTSKYEDQDEKYAFIPKHLLSNNPDIDRTLAFQIIRSVVSAEFSNIKDRPKRDTGSAVMRMGYAGPAWMLEELPDTFNVAEGLLTSGDLERARGLYDLPERTGGRPKIIMPTSSPYQGRTPPSYEAALVRVNSNADSLEGDLEREIQEGRAVVIRRAVFDSRTQHLLYK